MVECMNATAQHDYSTRARGALEIVCSGGLSRIEEFYAPEFVDHVNDSVFHGHSGARASVGFYQRLLADLHINVEDQISEGNRVASRWIMQGAYRGRPVTLRGITISIFDEQRRIREDHSHSDTITLLRQLGPLRSVALGLELLTRRIKRPNRAVSATG
jgi:hypothetical protein